MDKVEERENAVHLQYFMRVAKTVTAARLVVSLMRIKGDGRGLLGRFYKVMCITTCSQSHGILID
jgi:hypothetical protein